MQRDGACQSIWQNLFARLHKARASYIPVGVQDVVRSFGRYHWDQYSVIKLQRSGKRCGTEANNIGFGSTGGGT